MTRLSCVLLVIATLAAAQQTAPSKRIRVHLPASVPAKSVVIVYFLGGPFGGHSAQVQPREDKLVYTLPMSTKELAATRMKGVIWAKGCELRTYDLDLLHSAERELTYECLVPSSVVLTGRLHLNDSVRKKPHHIAITYGASWVCGFFGLGDCMVPGFRVGTVTPADDETFTVELPDFSHIPQSDAHGMVVSDSSFSLFLLDSTMTPIKELQPELKDVTAPDGNLKVLSVYPPDLAFSPFASLP